MSEPWMTSHRKDEFRPTILDYGDEPIPHSCREVIWELEKDVQKKLKITAKVMCSCGTQYQLRKASFWYTFFYFYYHSRASYTYTSHAEWVRCG